MNIKIIFEPMLGKSKPVNASIRRSKQVLDPNCDIISQNFNFISHKNFDRLSF
jgi:hypothetical protein